MHMDYKKQLEMKEDQIRQSLVRIGKIENPQLLPITGMENPYNFRNKAQFLKCIVHNTSCTKKGNAQAPPIIDLFVACNFVIIT